MDLLQLIDYAGIAAFSISGVFAAMEKKLDVFGVFIIAFVTALGGGTLRDIMIGDLPVVWMHNLSYGAVVLISTIVTLLFTKPIHNYQKTLLLFDSIGLGFFTILGIQKGILHELHPVICIALGTITACFGGVIRDISLNNIPIIFQKTQLYATACIAGGLIYFLLLRIGLPEMVAEIICIIIIVILRLLAVKFNWRLPAIGGERED